MKYKIKDILIILFITIVYSILSFINLGTIVEPQTFWKAENISDTCTIKLDEVTYIDKMRIYVGPRSNEYDIYISNNGDEYSYLKTIEEKSVFSWNDIEINEELKFMRLTAKDSNIYLGEIALYNYDNKIVNATGVEENAKYVMDEKEAVPEEISYLNSSYFDEVYHPRTAYEYVNNLDIYEWTHPPLGKLIMSIPIRIFGMSPFSYRLMGNIAGILMIPIIYIFGMEMFKNRKYAILAAIIMACDNFHFAQTRLATVDSYLVLFIMLAFLFMYKYIKLEDKEKLTKKIKMLFFSGLFMGCAIATKWTGCFAAIGLAIIFFIHFIKINIVEKIEKTKDNINIQFKEKKWSVESTVTVWFCFVFFVIIPILIYCACYIPDKNINTIEDIWNLQIDMYNYHSQLKETHPFSSNWYTWFIMQKPVWYYLGETQEGITSTISGIGNPIIWWTGIIGMVYVFLKGIIKQDKDSIFIIIAIITALIPYLGIGRDMFLYHYFPILPFMYLCLVILIKDLENKTKCNKISAIYIFIIFIIFIYFYPVVSGMKVSTKYIESTKWLKTWYY